MRDLELICSTGAEVFPFESEIADLYARIFPDISAPGYVESKFSRMVDPALHMAVHAGTALAFKLGYRQSDTVFYSWLGGVLPENRRRGLAELLMQEQHDWARAQGYLEIETRTRENNGPMLSLNRKTGFHIVGHREARHGRMAVLRMALQDAQPFGATTP